MTRRIHLIFEAVLVSAGIGSIVQPMLPGMAGLVVTVVSLVVYWWAK